MPLAVAGCVHAGSHDGNNLDLSATASSDLQAPADFAFVVGPTCEDIHPGYWTVAADDAGIGIPDGGVGNCYYQSPCAQLCKPGFVYCCYQAGDMSGLNWFCAWDCGPAGRRPAGLRAARADRGDIIGRHFAQMAHLESASVHAFRRLAIELRKHDAPTRLVSAAHRAVADEVRHARIAGRIARAHGAIPTRVVIAPSQERSLEAIVVENAEEGCVRETFGALLANWQARAAQSLPIRAAMRQVARDETRHAELAWAIDAWAGRRLGVAARRRVAEARRAASAALSGEVVEPPPLLAQVAGVPSASQSRYFIARATQQLWA